MLMQAHLCFYTHQNDDLSHYKHWTSFAMSLIHTECEFWALGDFEAWGGGGCTHTFSSSHILKQRYLMEFNMWTWGPHCWSALANPSPWQTVLSKIVSHYNENRVLYHLVGKRMLPLSSSSCDINHSPITSIYVVLVMAYSTRKRHLMSTDPSNRVFKTSMMYCISYKFHYCA
jgi:hypothetical protein